MLKRVSPVVMFTLFLSLTLCIDNDKIPIWFVFFSSAKEIQLKHRAPVIGISIIDASCRPLPEPLEVEKGLAKPADTSGPHKVIIGSEEQFKVS
jgi:hypothetical protein